MKKETRKKLVKCAVECIKIIVSILFGYNLA